MTELEEKLIIGARVRLDKKTAEKFDLPEGAIITLEKGGFEYDNGLCTEIEYAPAYRKSEKQDWDSIYHIWENDLSGFGECKILN